MFVGLLNEDVSCVNPSLALVRDSRCLAVAGPCLGKCGFLCGRDDLLPAACEQTWPPSEQLQVSSGGSTRQTEQT